MPPFSVLHVCMGNICRSPMAERLLRARTADMAGSDQVDTLLFSHSVGTGGWHVGQSMNPPAARQLRSRGVDPSGFKVRRLNQAHLDASDLVLPATWDVAEYVRSLRPDVAARTFVLGELGRLLTDLDDRDLPAGAPTPQAVYNRGTALVKLLDRQRGGEPSLPTDDLDDPYGMDERYFARVAGEIDATVRPLAAVLIGQ
jgi:protein-tyrosine phosphatase